MDCEKFESTLLDELYDELDEVTSAAAKRHVSGCARCASLLSGLKATRRVAVLPIVEPPAGLEDRIFAAAREAQKVVPLRRRASRAISWAGSWAMRPQTGMAAVFLLMTGMSALLLRAKHSAPASSMTVSEQGEPVPTAATGMLQRPPGDPLDKAAPLVLAPLPPPGQAPAASDSKSDSLDGVLARGRAHASGAGRLNTSAKPTPMPADAPKALAGLDRDDYESPRVDSQKPAPPPRRYAPPSGGGGAAPAAPQPLAEAAEAPAASATSPAFVAQSSSGFNGAMLSFNAGDYATATTLFDGLASGGDLTSALWAARSVRKGSGCAAAAPRFDQVARAAAGTTAGYDATFEGGQCYRQMGQTDVAQARFRSLITVPSYVDRAKNELAQMGPRPAAKAQITQGKGYSPQAPATQQATPPAAPANRQSVEAK
jgi:hypothetical protein